MKRLAAVLFFLIIATGSNTFAVPAAPQFFNITNSGTTYTFSWNQVPGAGRYIMNYMLASNSSEIYQWDMGPITSLSFEISGNLKAYVAINAADQSGSGGYSQILYMDTEQDRNSSSNSGVLGPDGGTLAVTGKDSPLFGAAAVFPSGSLGNNAKIGIQETSLPSTLPDRTSQAGIPVNFTSTTPNFNKPVRLILPYKDADNDGFIDGTNISESSVGGWYFNEGQSLWEEKTVVWQDTNANLVTIETDHFSTYITLGQVDVLPDVPEETGLIPGEYFRGAQALNENACIKQSIGNCGSPYFLTVEKSEIYFTGVIDKHVTRTGGIPVTISEDNKSASFDATAVFEKVGLSGSAALWQWDCDFVGEHTTLVDYVAVEQYDLNTPPVAGGEKIYATISVDPDDEKRIIINWGVDITEQLVWGYRLAIKFEATYVGADEQADDEQAVDGEEDAL